MNVWGILPLIALCTLALYVLEVRLGSHTHLYYPELGLDVEEGKLIKLSAREFLCQALPLMLGSILVAAVPALLGFLAQIF